MSVQAKESKTGCSPDQDANAALQRTATTKFLTCVILWEFRALSLDQPTLQVLPDQHLLPTPLSTILYFFTRVFLGTDALAPLTFTVFTKAILSKTNQSDGTNPWTTKLTKTDTAGRKSTWGPSGQKGEARSKLRLTTREYSERCPRQWRKHAFQ